MKSEKTTSSNTAFFKTGGRMAAAKTFETHAEETMVRDHPHGEAAEGRNFIPGAAPVGETGSTKAAKKK